MHDVAEFLSEREPFSSLEEGELERLAERVRVEFFPAGTTIFRQGEGPLAEVRVVRRGAVELVDAGRVLDVLGEGEMFGHPSMLSGLPTGWEARAGQDTLCYAISAGDVVPLLARPASLRFVARSLLARPRADASGALGVTGFDAAHQAGWALLRERPLVCDPETTVRDGARRMAEARMSALLVRLAGGGFGIVTDHDLRARVVAAGLAVETPISEVMSTPVITAGAERSAGELILMMLDHGISHLPLLSASGEVLGVLRDLDLLAAESRTPFVIRRAIAGATNPEELRRAAGRVGSAVISLHSSGVAPEHVSPIISVAADATVRRAIELATEELGEPPGEICWLALGSHGRREAVPSSDIDSGLVWEDGEPELAAAAKRIAERVGEYLDLTGWRADAHGVTASGTVAARSAAEWREAISDWLHGPPSERVLIAASILLDGRAITGPEDGMSVFSAIREARHRPRLLRLMLRLAIAHRPPTGFRHDIVVEHSGEHRGSFDIKRGGLLPIVEIARYAGLAAGATTTATLERLRAAATAGTLRATEARSLEHAHDLLATLRLEHQVEQLRAGAVPDDHVDPKTLDELTRHYLRDAFRAVASVQKRFHGELTWGAGP